MLKNAKISPPAGNKAPELIHNFADIPKFYQTFGSIASLSASKILLTSLTLNIDESGLRKQHIPESREKQVPQSLHKTTNNFPTCRGFNDSQTFHNNFKKDGFKKREFFYYSLQKMNDQKKKK